MGRLFVEFLNCPICEREVHSWVGVCDDCYNHLKKQYDTYFPQRPNPIRDIDQFFMDFDSLVAQCSFLSPKIKNSPFGCFGGYDGTGLIAANFHAKSVSIIDINGPILKWYADVGSELDSFK